MNQNQLPVNHVSKFACPPSPHIIARVSGFRNRVNFCLWKRESWALESGIPLTIRIRDPSSTDEESRIWYLESGIQGVESRIHDCLGFPY